jgi:putative addiction module component (TIGR02574 family)
MSATDLIEQMRPMPTEEKRAFIERVWEEYGEELGWTDSELTPEQSAELDRRAEDALKNPGRGKPAEQVFAEIQERLLAKK